MDKKSGIFTTTLVQQTPMIHFQSEEDGVCFRPSEAKPKLDRFLMYYFKRKGIQVRDEWFVDKALNNALKYKMQVKALGRPEVLELGNKDDKKAYDALFFGNMGAKESEKKKTIEYRNSNILLKIVCFDDTLMTHIQECIPPFFLLHNFGTRQSKCFGGFCVQDVNPDRAEELLKESLDCPFYRIDYSKKNAIYKDVNDIYSILKKGINLNGKYVKSFLTTYFLDEKKIGGEKRYIKSHNIAPAIRKSNQNGSYKMNIEGNEKVNEFRYIRALFGAAEKIEYIKELDESDRPAKKFDGKRDKVMKVDVKIASLDGIERIPSPVFFKIVENTLFIIPFEPNPQIYGKRYLFTSTMKERNGMNDSEREGIQIPNKEEFDMEDFFEKYVDFLNTDANRCVTGLEFRNANKKIRQCRKGGK